MAKSQLVILLLLGTVACAAPERAAPTPTERAKFAVVTEKASAREVALKARILPDGKSADIGFAFTPPCRVPVVHVTSKKGLTSTATYDVVVESRGEHLSVVMEGMKIVSMKRGDIELPDAAGLEVDALVDSVTPSFVVSKQGDFIRVENQAAVTEAALSALGAGVDEQAKERLRAVLGNPTVQAALSNKSGDLWNMWAGAWIGAKLKPGQVEKLDVPTPIVPNLVLTMKSELTHQGQVVGRQDLVLLQLKSLVAGPEAEKALLELMRKMSRSGGGPPVPDGATKGLRQQSHILAAIEPHSGRPHRVRLEATTELGGKRRQETRDVTFHWNKAQGCGR